MKASLRIVDLDVNRFKLKINNLHYKCINNDSTMSDECAKRRTVVHSLPTCLTPGSPVSIIVREARRGISRSSSPAGAQSGMSTFAGFGKAVDDRRRNGHAR